MQFGAVFASLGGALSPASRRHLARFGKPLAVVAVLAIGATFFSGAAALIGTRQPTAGYQAAAEGLGGGTGRDLHALPQHPPSSPLPVEPSGQLPGRWVIALDDSLAGLKEGAFGVTFAPPSLDSPAAGATGDALVPSVLVDADRPPLRIEIMGFDTVASRAPATQMPKRESFPHQALQPEAPR